MDNLSRFYSYDPSEKKYPMENTKDRIQYCTELIETFKAP